MTKFLSIIFAVALAVFHAEEFKAGLPPVKDPFWAALLCFALFLIISIAISNSNRTKR